MPRDRSHRCHGFGCGAPCPPRWLLCRPCWDLVPPAVQREINRTVGLRGPAVDATWAPWWRAQALAVTLSAVARGADPVTLSFRLSRERCFAAELEEV